jgi:hypothetical protein
VALDDERAAFRYHHLVRQLLRAELRARDWGRELALQLRAAEWFEATGDMRRAARYFLAARQVDRALALLQGRVMADYLHNPEPPQHGENPSPVDLPEARGDFALAGPSAGRRPVPALTPAVRRPDPAVRPAAAGNPAVTRRGHGTQRESSSEG